jgi:hypothetical protein
MDAKAHDVDFSYSGRKIAEKRGESAGASGINGLGRFFLATRSNQVICSSRNTRLKKPMKFKEETVKAFQVLFELYHCKFARTDTQWGFSWTTDGVL